MNYTNAINFGAENLSSDLLFVTLESFDYNLREPKSETPEKKLVSDEEQIQVNLVRKRISAPA